MPQTAEQLAEDTKWAVKALTEGNRFTEYRTYREYYDGTQDMEFATDKFAKAFSTQLKTFAYNRCGTVVDAIADRLTLTGFSTWGLEEAEEDTNQEQIELIWRANRFDKKQGDFAREALLVGNAYWIVWPEPVPTGGYMPMLYLNSPETTVIRYDEDTKRKLVAAKLWHVSGGPDDGKWRLNLFYSDNVYKYVTADKKDSPPKEPESYTPFVPDPELVQLGIVAAEPWPLPNPWGQIPVFQYANRVNEGHYGRSELKDVLPLQNALNKACMDLIVAMEYGAYPQRWATGLSLGLPDPITGKVVSPFRQGPGEVWSAGEKAAFGDFNVTDLSQFISVQESFDKKISNVARIPTHWLNMGDGEAPSGESLKTAEAPFVGKLKGLTVAMGDTHEDAFALALTQAGTADAELDAIWAGIELRSDLDRANVATLRKQYGYSNEELQRQDGLSQDTIERMQEENQEAVKVQQEQFAAGFGTGFPPGGGNEPPANAEEEDKEEERE